MRQVLLSITAKANCRHWTGSVTDSSCRNRSRASSRVPRVTRYLAAGAPSMVRSACVRSLTYRPMPPPGTNPAEASTSTNPGPLTPPRSRAGGGAGGRRHARAGERDERGRRHDAREIVPQGLAQPVVEDPHELGRPDRAGHQHREQRAPEAESGHEPHGETRVEPERDEMVARLH